MAQRYLMRILCLTHAPFEGPAAIADWARTQNHTLEIVECWRKPMPAPVGYQALVIMGGPMSVLDSPKLPWLAAELDWISAWIEADQGPVIGICLGSQMLAQILGGDVTRSIHKEIGWWPVQRTPEAALSYYFNDWPQGVDLFHWHGEMSLLPPDARITLSSPGCPVQAFEHGPRIVGLQCHPEMTLDSIREIGHECQPELVASRYIQTDVNAMADPARIKTAHAHLFELLDRLFVG